MSAAWLVLAVTATAACGHAPPAHDLLIRGATVLDGSGAPGRVADVAVAGGRIAAIADSVEAAAARTVDGAGLVLAPGFVDAHSHADLILLGDRATQERLLEAKIRQGVTTVVVGNCGLGVAPSDAASAPVLAAVNGWMTPEGIAPGPLSVGGYLGRLERGGVALNVAMLAPHGPVRITAMGLAEGAPTPGQLDAMRAAVARALDEGAFGLSTGLIYPPGMYAATDELVSLAEVVASRDRLFTSHVRGSSETLLPATRELIEVARRSGARAHHSHLEAVGERFWGGIAEALALEDRARAEGARLSHDVFPYTRAATMMAALFPPWSLEGGVPRLLERLGDPATRARIREEIGTRTPSWPPWRPGGWPHNLVGAVGWDGIVVASVRPGGPAELVGRDLAAIAGARGQDPFDVVADLMVAQGGQVGQQVDEISGRDPELDALLAILRHPAAAVISDAEDYGRGSPHPAHAGAFVRALRLARERGLMDVAEAVRRMTSRPASIVGLADRGRIAPGLPADLVLFDAAAVADRATWEEPRRPAEGVRLVVVNGRVVVDGGRYLGGMPGAVLRAGGR
jgi:N-acyl-D-aspartate/D-glutamate deacylase